MLKSTFRGMIAHKLRLVLTTASISLGVAFLAGTLILTDTMNLAFEQLFGKVSSGTDAVVRTEASFTQSSGVGTNRAPIASSVLDDVLDRRRRPDRRGVRQRLRAAHRQRRQGDPHHRRRPDHGLHAWPRTRASAVRSSSCPATAPHGPDDVVIDADQRRGERHRARLDDQGPLPGPHPGVHRGRHRRLRRREEPGRQHGGVLRRGHGAGGARRRPAPSTPSAWRPRTASARPALADRLDAVVPEGTEAVTGPRSRRRTPTPSRRS